MNSNEYPIVVFSKNATIIRDPEWLELLSSLMAKMYYLQKITITIDLKYHVIIIINIDFMYIYIIFSSWC